MLSPTANVDRIQSLDLLRGFAVLGILAMNIQAYSMILVAAFNPSAYGDLTGLNKLVWFLTYVLVEQKFYSLFTILFGAGIVLMRDRNPAGIVAARNLHYRRMLWLLLFGLVHGFLIWTGDILASYAITGLLIYWFASKSVRLLLIMAASCFLLPALLQIGMFVFAPPEFTDEFRKFWNPSDAAIHLETNAYVGTWLEQTGARSVTFVQQLMQAIFFGGVVRLAATMFFGMVLFKTGILSGQRTRSFYTKGLLLGLSFGLTLTVIAAFRRLSNDFEFSSEYINILNYFAAPFIAFGYICGAMLVLKTIVQSTFGKSLIAVGRMAFTNYIMQSVICTFIFYGFGLSLYGQIERTGQLAIVIGVWILQLVLSPWWLSRYRYGPLEWLWRGLSYRNWQPISSGEPRRPF